MAIVLHNLPPKAADLVRSKTMQLERLKETAREQADDAVNSIEIVGAAFAFGLLEGRYPEKARIEGIPTSAVVGVGSYLVSFFSGRTYGPHLRAIGKGALAASGYVWGKELGADRRASQEGTSVGGVYPFPRAVGAR